MFQLSGVHCKSHDPPSGASAGVQVRHECPNLETGLALDTTVLVAVKRCFDYFCDKFTSYFYDKGLMI